MANYSHWQTRYDSDGHLAVPPSPGRPVSEQSSQPFASEFGGYPSSEPSGSQQNLVSSPPNPPSGADIAQEDPASNLDAEDEIYEGVLPEDPKDLAFCPTILQPLPTFLLVSLYILVLVGIAMLYWRSRIARPFYISSENVHMIARYFPSILGTITVLLFQRTAREFIRMRPYIAMSDQRGRRGELLVRTGALPVDSVSGGFFPWQDITVSPGIVAWLSLILQVIASFIVSFKVALLATTSDGTKWTLTVRSIPALFLILAYILMTLYTVCVGIYMKKKCTGLKWDPVSIADYLALFAKCNALNYFAPLELRHTTSAKDGISEQQYFRIGYWNVRKRGPHEPKLVYGIGIGHGDVKANKKLVSNAGPATKSGKTKDPPPLQKLNKDNKRCECHDTPWHKPRCPHYPYRRNPGFPRWVIVFFTIIVLALLGLMIFVLIKRWPFTGFDISNAWSLPPDWHISVGSHTIDLATIDPDDPVATLLIYSLLLKSVPTYTAGLFINTIIPGIDLNMRFMQPFVNMFEQPGPASRTILLGYMTLSPLEVPLTAYNNGDMKVAWFSSLNTVSPLFPIFVGGLLTISPKVDDLTKIHCSFSLTAVIGIMFSLFIYGVSFPIAFPYHHRLLPRQFWSMADLMCMCYQSHFLDSPHLDIADRRKVPDKSFMEAKILLSRSEFLFGSYKGRDNKYHMGFDVAKIEMGTPGKPEPTGFVSWIEPNDWFWPFTKRGRAYTAKTSQMEQGRGAYEPIYTGNDFTQGAQRANYYEMDDVTMSGGLRPRTNFGSV